MLHQSICTLPKFRGSVHCCIIQWRIVFRASLSIDGMRGKMHVFILLILPLHYQSQLGQPPLVDGCFVCLPSVVPCNAVVGKGTGALCIVIVSRPLRLLKLACVTALRSNPPTDLTITLRLRRSSVWLAGVRGCSSNSSKNGESKTGE